MDTGSTMPEPSVEHGDPQLALREARRLLNIAYRLLGSMTEAEDAVQETMSRCWGLSEAHRESINSPAAWLTTVCTRVCLDLLRSARRQREVYVGPWLPEPIPSPTMAQGDRSAGVAPDPADLVVANESVAMAYLVALETLTPAERVVLVMHDVYGYTFRDIASLVRRTPDSCRQLATTARRRLRGAPLTRSSVAVEARVVGEFMAAWSAGDVARVVALLDADAVAVADGGGEVAAATSPVIGAESIARECVAILRRDPSLTLCLETVNGRPGVVARQMGSTVAVFSFGVAAAHIVRIWAVRNPRKLRAW